jgi:hypothetical protein
LGFEFKYADAPTITNSMRIALEDLELERITIVYPGDRSYDLDERISVMPLGSISDTAKRVVP